MLEQRKNFSHSISSANKLKNQTVKGIKSRQLIIKTVENAESTTGTDRMKSSHRITRKATCGFQSEPTNRKSPHSSVE